MTGYRIASTTPTGGQIMRENIGRAAELIAELSHVLGPADVYEGLSVSDLRVHQADLVRLSGLAVAATAKAGNAYARAGGLREDGTASLHTHFRNGRSNREAAELAALANACELVPDTIDALAQGDLSPVGASVIARAVKDERLGDNPADVERELLAVGRGKPPDVIRRYVETNEQKRDGDRLRMEEARQHKLRNLSITERGDGMWNLRGQLPAVLGEKTKVLLESLTTRDPADTPDSEKRTSVQRTADAFADIVDRMLDHGDLPTSGGQARPHINVTIDVSTVAADLTAAHDDAAVSGDDEIWATLPPGSLDWMSRPLSPQAVRQLCCDAVVTRIVMNGPSQVLDVGRATPTWSGPQRTAIRTRDRQCRGPRCDRPIGWTEIHHLQWFRNGGETNLDNGVSLCRKCHDLVHHAGWTATLDTATAAVTWVGPDGRTVVTEPPDRLQ